MINDFKADAITWKYIDDLIIAQTVARGSVGSVQKADTAIEVRSQQNRMQLNASGYPNTERRVENTARSPAEYF